MARVYLETSFFSACVSRRTDPKSAYWREAGIEWWKTQARRHELFISDEVVAELSDPQFSQREEALAMLRGLRSLEFMPEVLGLAKVLVQEKLMPAPAVAGDALHLAVATVHRAEYLLSWNVKHMANPNKRTHLAVVCLRLGLVAPQIVTPDLLTEAEDD